MTANVFNCAECGEKLSPKRAGWITVQAGFDQGRVHTLCKSKFEARTLEDQKHRIAKAG